MRKKLTIGLFIILIFSFGLKLYKEMYAGDVYYTKIQVIPDRKTQKDSDGNYKYYYDYVKNVYSETKEVKTINFKERSNHPIKVNSYLRLMVNSKNKVISWEEIEKEDIPPKVLDQMSSNK